MSNDSNLQQVVLEELNWEPSIEAGHVGVAADMGIVTLTGWVDSYAQKQAAERIVRRLKGVRAIVEEIKVRLAEGTARGDAEIAAAAVHCLAWDTSIPNEAVKVQVEQGWVILTGELDWQHQRYTIEKNLAQLIGVTGISNHTVLKKRVEASNVCANIMGALQRTCGTTRCAVSVTADGGKIRLRGTVYSQHDRYAATETAWASPGTSSVDNKITVV
jgi:osmotically-inducible protein OsmY